MAIKNFVYALTLATTLLSTVTQAQDRFFANPVTQREAPRAFALQPEAGRFISSIEKATQRDRDALVRAIKSDREVMSAIHRIRNLSLRDSVLLLKRVFEIQVHVMKISPPDLVFDEKAKTGAAYFDFDLNHRGPGSVIMNPTDFASLENRLGILTLLIHETRHSAQFQFAFSPQHKKSALAKGFKEAFIAQKQIKGMTFIDFMTLLNEYEAFQFANYVVGQLTEFRVDMVDMGSYASQYDSRGLLKIDLATLLSEVGPKNLLQKFNELESDQFERLNTKN